MNLLCHDVSWKQSLHVWVCAFRWQLSWDTADSTNSTRLEGGVICCIVLYVVIHCRGLEPLVWRRRPDAEPVLKAWDLCCEGTNMMIQQGWAARPWGLDFYIPIISQFHIVRPNFENTFAMVTQCHIDRTLDHPNLKKSNHAVFLADLPTKGEPLGMDGWTSRG